MIQVIVRKELRDPGSLGLREESTYDLAEGSGEH